MDSYTVYFKTAGQVRWRKLRRVVLDGFTAEGRARWFALKDATRVEIPTSFLFRFPRERAVIIDRERQSRQEAGEPAEN